MTILDIGPAVGSLRTEEEDLLASFTQGLIRIVAVAGARGTSSSPIAALNAMRLPAIALDQHGFVADANAAADVVFDNDIKIKDRRLFVRDPAARTHLKEVIDRLKDLHRLDSVALEPIIVPRTDKLPVIVRIWPFEAPAQDARALLTRDQNRDRQRRSSPRYSGLRHRKRNSPPSSRAASLPISRPGN
jgi:hypothetical protein